MIGSVRYRLPKIPYLHLRFKLSAQQEALLPRFKGSLLRGTYGHSLRRMVCVMGSDARCYGCLLRSRCIYSRFFETYIEGPAPPFLRGLQTAPRPFAISAFNENRFFRENEMLPFDLLLFGQATEMHPYAIYAVSKAAEKGLGEKRYRFKLESVLWRKSGPLNNGAFRPLYDGKSKRIVDNPAQQLANQRDGEVCSIDSFENACSIRFLTPTRLKFKNRFRTDFTFRMLAFKMLRRVLELAHFHVPGEPVDWTFRPLLEAANKVRIVSQDLKWKDWQRRSNRQDIVMKLGGFVGKISLEGDLSPFVELLRVCEVVRVGKGVVFGNGEMACSFYVDD